MNQDILSKPISELSDEEFEAAAKARSAKKKQEAKKRRELYVANRETMIKSLSGQALDLHKKLADFKNRVFEQLDMFYIKMLEYGELPKGNKGSYSIKSDDGILKIEYVNHIIREFDERSEAAAVHMENFLKDFVKKRDHKAYEMIKSLLHRKGKDNKFDVNLINRLEQMRDEFDHEEWIKALDLFKESYTENGSTRYVRFYVRNGSTQQLEQVQLNFSNVAIISDLIQNQGSK